MSRLGRVKPFVLLAAALLVMLATRSALAGGPDIQFDQLELVFSDVKEGSTLTASFPFTNKGDQNLLIEKVSPSCGCTVPAYDKITMPGARGKVDLILDTKDITGSFRKTAVVATNDPVKPFVTVIMLGETISRIQVDKGRRLELRGCVGGDISTTATLTDPDGRPLLITTVENPMAHYMDANLERGADGKSYKLHLKAKGTEPVEFAGPMFLVVPGAPKVSIWVSADVMGSFRVQPRQVFFGGINPARGQGMSRSILVEKACSEKLTLDGLVYDKSKLEVRESWRKPGEELLLVATPKPEGLAKGPYEEELGIKAQGGLFRVKLKGTVY